MEDVSLPTIPQRRAMVIVKGHRGPALYQAFEVPLLCPSRVSVGFPPLLFSFLVGAIVFPSFGDSDGECVFDPTSIIPGLTTRSSVALNPLLLRDAPLYVGLLDPPTVSDTSEPSQRG
jgi:hypothetical protein